MLLVMAKSERIARVRPMTGSATKQSKKSRHTPPPGLASGEPDDRLQRGIHYAAAFRFDHRRLWNTGSSAFADDDDRECGAVVLNDLPTIPFSNSQTIQT
jgi:hypothetical protein